VLHLKELNRKGRKQKAFTRGIELDFDKEFRRFRRSCLDSNLLTVLRVFQYFGLMAGRGWPRSFQAGV